MRLSLRSQSPASMHAILHKSTTLRAKLAELKALERSIAAFVATRFNLFGRPCPDCVILDDLSKCRELHLRRNEK